MTQEHSYLNEDDIVYGIPAKRYQAAIQGWIEVHDYDGQSDQSRHDTDCALNHYIASKEWTEQECIQFLKEYEGIGNEIIAQEKLIFSLSDMLTSHDGELDTVPF